MSDLDINRLQQRAYRRAIRDAVKAVNAISEDYDGDEWEQGCMALRVAVAAIKSLASTPDVIESDKEQRHHD